MSLLKTKHSKVISESSRRRSEFAAETGYIPNWEVPKTEFLFSEEEIASMDQHSKEVARSVLERAENICKSYNNIKFEVKECRGDARDVICDMVEKLNADMLVMGCHGYGFIKRAFLGSVSNYCAQNAKCPIVIVKRPAQ